MMGFLGLLRAQSNLCVPIGQPVVVRAEGLTERIGDIVYDCGGIPNTTLTGNFTVFLNANVTNRISSGTTLTGIVFTIDSGSGPQPVLVQPTLNSQSSLVYNGVGLTYSPQGRAVLRIAGIRTNATQIPVGNAIAASLAINGAGLLFTSSRLTVATPQRGLYAGFSSSLVCSQNGSRLPDTINFTNLIRANTAFASTRVTEGFNDAFGARSAPANLNADSGARIIVRYSGFPDGARLFVPDVVAGSDAIQPTAGGDFGQPASGGAYAPSSSGSLLLARVAGADANGAGGTPVYAPGPIGSATVGFNSVAELSLANGVAYAVYEVVDANPSRQETAQFPAFLGLAGNGLAPSSVQTFEEVFLAPVSNAGNASATERVPRFLAIAPPADCAIVGDCGTYLPQLSVDTSSIQYTMRAGAGGDAYYIRIHNGGMSSMPWQTAVTYQEGNGWLRIQPSASGVDDATVRVDAIPGSLPVGVYHATLTIDAGPVAGARSIAVTLVLTPAPAAIAPTPAINTVVNSASNAPAPVVPGSLTTIRGSSFTGTNKSVTFDGIPATILFSNADQLNLMAPAELGTKTSAQLVVTVDGSSASRTVPLAPFAPAIFTGAILNQDSTVNGANSGADAGSVIYLYATGLSGAGTITGHIHDRDIALPYYAGPAPGLPGVQQVNLVVPGDLPSMTTELYICGTGAAAPNNKVCSSPAPLTIR